MRTWTTAAALGAGLAMGWSGTARADAYDPPVGYYNSVTGTGATLRSTLNARMKSPHVMRTYANATIALPLLDRDPNNPANVIMIYSGDSVPSVWDSGNTWNREHTWPDSRGLGGSGMDYSDLHQLRPCIPGINSSRGNDPFGVSGGYFDPGSYGVLNDRGEMARAMMYMDVRYDGTDASTTDLVLVDSFPSGSQMGHLSTLLEWHYEYPVDNAERRRNHLVYSQADNPTYYQGNRNGFVDNPQYAWAIFGPTPNNANMYVGPSRNADGSSTVTISSRVLQGTPVGTQNVTLTKSSFLAGTVNPTSYEILLTGAATCPQAGMRQSWGSGVRTRTLTVGLSGVSGPGSYSGSVLIDNTDLTSAGVGMGANDANDTITLSAIVVTASNGSFSGSSDVDNSTVNLGAVEQSGTATPQTVQIWNLATTPGFTAGLDIDGITGGGDTGAFVTNFVTSLNLSAGAARSFTVALNPAAGVGVHGATYTFAVSDENIPGAMVRPNLTLTLTGEITAPQPACPADLTGDGFVDDSDFVQFAEAYDQFSVPPANPACDFTGDGFVDDSDFVQFAEAYDAFVCP